MIQSSSFSKEQNIECLQILKEFEDKVASLNMQLDSTDQSNQKKLLLACIKVRTMLITLKLPPIGQAFDADPKIDLMRQQCPGFVNIRHEDITDQNILTVLYNMAAVGQGYTEGIFTPEEGATIDEKCSEVVRCAELITPNIPQIQVAQSIIANALSKGGYIPSFYKQTLNFYSFTELHPTDRDNIIVVLRQMFGDISGRNLEELSANIGIIVEFNQQGNSNYKLGISPVYFTPALPSQFTDDSDVHHTKIRIPANPTGDTQAIFNNLDARNNITSQQRNFLKMVFSNLALLTIDEYNTFMSNSELVNGLLQYAAAYNPHAVYLSGTEHIQLMKFLAASTQQSAPDISQMFTLPAGGCKSSSNSSLKLVLSTLLQQRGLENAPVNNVVLDAAFFNNLLYTDLGYPLPTTGFAPIISSRLIEQQAVKAKITFSHVHYGLQFFISVDVIAAALNKSPSQTRIALRKDVIERILDRSTELDQRIKLLVGKGSDALRSIHRPALAKVIRARSNVTIEITFWKPEDAHRMMESANRLIPVTPQFCSTSEQLPCVVVIRASKGIGDVGVRFTKDKKYAAINFEFDQQRSDTMGLLHMKPGNYEKSTVECSAVIEYLCVDCTYDPSTTEICSANSSRVIHSTATVAGNATSANHSEKSSLQIAREALKMINFKAIRIDNPGHDDKWKQVAILIEHFTILPEEEQYWLFRQYLQNLGYIYENPEAAILKNGLGLIFFSEGNIRDIEKYSGHMGLMSGAAYEPTSLFAALLKSMIICSSFGQMTNSTNPYDPWNVLKNSIHDTSDQAAVNANLEHATRAWQAAFEVPLDMEVINHDLPVHRESGRKQREEIDETAKKKLQSTQSSQSTSSATTTNSVPAVNLNSNQITTMSAAASSTTSEDRYEENLMECMNLLGSKSEIWRTQLYCTISKRDKEGLRKSGDLDSYAIEHPGEVLKDIQRMS